MRLAIVLLFLLAVSASAADQPKVSIDLQNEPLSKAIQMLSEQSGQQIIIDSGVTGSVTAQLSNLDFEQVLDVIIKSNDLRWHKLYAKPDDTGQVPLASVKAQIEALAAVSDIALIVYDPATKKQTVFARVEKSADETVVDPGKLGLKAFYLITKPKPPAPKEEAKKPPAADPGGRYAQIINQRLDTLMRMTPDQRRLAFQQEAQWMLSLPRDAQVEMIRGMFGAVRDMNPQVREQWMRMMGSAFGGHAGGGPGGRTRRGGQ